MVELYDFIFQTVDIPVGFEFLRPFIFMFFLGFGSVLTFSLFKVIIDKIF